VDEIERHHEIVLAVNQPEAAGGAGELGAVVDASRRLDVDLDTQQ
jgi:hypothetical protein